ncbi:MAG: HAMP domain-containing histidine kinase [Clostridiales bacterium]|nr:HAMP domain-containing histidine kinase [Clostridiales bacterium]
MTRRKITRRWMLNNLSVIITMLLIFEIAFAGAVRSYFYKNVEYSLEKRAEGVMATYMDYDLNAGMTNSYRTFVDRFQDKDLMEIQVLDASGRVLISSLGFVPRQESMPDYAAACTSSDRTGVWHGRNSAGENVMAYTTIMTGSDGTFIGALRYVVSLSPFDRQLWLIIGVMGLFSVIVVLFVVFSSTYFVNSIVQPVMDIGRAARRIALGDYQFRIEKKYDDEIGDLCDTINYMAGEISAAEKVKNDFISSVSHELRTPLTAIKGWGETLRQVDRGDAEMLDKGLEVIIGEAERLSGIVEELLDFSRMQGGRLNMKFGKMDILAELDETVLLFRERAAREGVGLQYIETEDLPPVVGDRDRLKQVFINVIDNAIKYTGQGGRVRIETADMSGRVQIVISDTGMGISKEDLPNVKEKFYRANHTRPGSGIGLALADEIIRWHKGRLDIDSEEGVGTTVTILLPAAPPAALGLEEELPLPPESADRPEREG